MTGSRGPGVSEGGGGSGHDGVFRSQKVIPRPGLIACGPRRFCQDFDQGRHGSRLL